LSTEKKIIVSLHLIGRQRRKFPEKHSTALYPWNNILCSKLCDTFLSARIVGGILPYKGIQKSKFTAAVKKVSCIN
jgi:hypothetical protein